nr:GNAT family N-acetyltransferase [Halopenitus persicus]
MRSRHPRRVGTEPAERGAMRIARVTSADERDAVFPVLQQLRDHLDREAFAELYEPMAEEGYRLFAGYVDGEPVAVAGVTISTNLYLGRHAYVYDLVVDEDHRSEGHGAEMLEHVHDWAAEEDCAAVELESGLWREDAHRFYLDLGYEKYCYSFKYDLE